MTNKKIQRNSKVVSVSLEPEVVSLLDQIRKEYCQSRSAVVASMIKKRALLEQWKQIRVWGEDSAKSLKIKSEEDVYKLLEDA